MKYRNIILSAMLACCVASCGEEKSCGGDGHDHDHHHATESGHSHGEEEGSGVSAGDIELHECEAKSAGIFVGEIQATPFYEVVKTSGEILGTRDGVTTVVAPAAGVVSFAAPLLAGDNVPGGKRLMTISSSRIEGGNVAEKNRVDFEIAKREFERVESLYADKIVAEKDYNAAKQIYENARISYEATRESGAGKGVEVIAATAGFVGSTLVNEGDYVQAGQPLLTVVRSNSLYLRADVSQRYLSALREVRGAKFKTPYDEAVRSLDDLDGKLESVGKSSGGGSFYVPVTFRFRNDGSMMPGSYVEVYLQCGTPSDAVAVPVGALIEEQGLYFVYKQTSPGHFAKTEVSVGNSDGERVRILSGVRAGDSIVTRGALRLKLMSVASAIPAHTHEH